MPEDPMTEDPKPEDVVHDIHDNWDFGHYKPPCDPLYPEPPRPRPV